MTVELTAQQLAKNWRKVLGVQTAFDDIPRTLKDAVLPAVVLFPGAATSEKLSADSELEIRLWRMVLYLDRATFGTEGQIQIASYVFFDRVKAQFRNKPQLTVDGDPEPQYAVYNAEYLGDQGFQIGQYPLDSEQYALIEFSERVSEVTEITNSGG